MDDPRSFTAVLSAVVFILATVCTVLYRWVGRIEDGAHGAAARLLLYSLWALALLGTYSGTSFIWADGLDDGWLTILRFIRLALTTAVGIMLGGVLMFWLRVIRRS